MTDPRRIISFKPINWHINKLLSAAGILPGAAEQERRQNTNPMIQFFVPGPPQGKARARTVSAYYGGTTTYTPAKTVVYEGLIRGCFREAASSPREPVFRKGVPIRIRIEAYYKPPVRTTKKDYALIQAGKKFPTRKPDIDNVTKAVCDALNHIAYNDDSQVVEIISAKYFSHEEGLRITVSSVLEEE